MCNHKCDCIHPEISKGNPSNCTLNQVIKCHGDQPLNEILKCHRNDDK